MDEPVFVVNSDGTVVSANATAQSLFGSDTVGDAFEKMLGQSVRGLRDVNVLEHRTSDGYRQFDPRVSTVTGGGGQRLGVTITLIDVTEREMRRERIQVLNRILRHNIRNDLSAIQARADLATDKDRNAKAQVKQIIDISDELEKLSTDARRIETLINRQGEETATQQLDEFIRSVVAEVTSTDETVEVTVTIPETSVTLNWELLRFALRNLIENAIEHNNTQTPVVEIVCEMTTFGAEVVVADDGPGIPEQEVTAVQAGSEDRLGHATSIGLWGTSWAVQSLGGKLTFEESHLGGAAVRVQIPLPDD
ncbi:putative PAS/PAC sensing his kinase [Halorubrum coriense DSM 10284]|uniref:histidine kinase n=2 Tax=Halorubrum coriense TaxID=64713 RepID=M0ERR0_9EURY|nr:putative PAS/PAC sensing his kinase [Halorubrum coriense DSM 10284]